MPSPFAEQLGLPVQVEDGFLVRSGLPARYLLSAEPGFCRSISAVRTLAKRRVRIGVAKKAVERLLVSEDITVDVPMVEDAALFEGELAEVGVRAKLCEAELVTTALGRAKPHRK